MDGPNPYAPTRGNKNMEQNNNLNTKTQKTTTTTPATAATTATAATITNPFVERPMKTKSWNDVLRSRYSKACFIMAKIENNLRNGTPQEYDESDRIKYTAVIDEYLKHKERQAALEIKGHSEKPQQQLQQQQQQEQNKQKNSATSSSIAGELCMALADISNGKPQPVVAKWPLIENGISNILHKYLLLNKNCPIPRYDSGEMFRGYVLYKCKDSFSKDFLSNCVTKLRDTFKGLTLTLIPAVQIPPTTNLNAKQECKKESTDNNCATNIGGNTLATNANANIECKPEIRSQVAVKDTQTSNTNTTTATATVAECQAEELFEAPPPPPAWHKETVETSSTYINRHKMTEDDYHTVLKRLEHYSSKKRKRIKDKRKIRKYEVMILNYERRNGLRKKTQEPVNALTLINSLKSFEAVVKASSESRESSKPAHNPFKWYNTTPQRPQVESLNKTAGTTSKESGESRGPPHNPFKWYNTTPQKPQPPAQQVESLNKACKEIHSGGRQQTQNTKPQNEGAGANNYFATAGTTSQESRESRRPHNPFRANIPTTKQQQTADMESLNKPRKISSKTISNYKRAFRFLRNMSKLDELTPTQQRYKNKYERMIVRYEQIVGIDREKLGINTEKHTTNDFQRQQHRHTTESKQTKMANELSNSSWNDGNWEAEEEGIYNEMQRDLAEYSTASRSHFEEPAIEQIRPLGFEQNLRLNQRENSPGNYGQMEEESYREMRGATFWEQGDTQAESFTERRRDCEYFPENFTTNRYRAEIPATATRSLQPDYEQILEHQHDLWAKHLPNSLGNYEANEMESQHETRANYTSRLRQSPERRNSFLEAEHEQMSVDSSWSNHETRGRHSEYSEYSPTYRTQFNTEPEIFTQQMPDLFNPDAIGRSQAHSTHNEVLKRKLEASRTSFSDNPREKVSILTDDSDDNVDVDAVSKEYYEAVDFLRRLESLDPADLSPEDRHLEEISRFKVRQFESTASHLKPQSRKSGHWQPSEPSSRYQTEANEQLRLPSEGPVDESYTDNGHWNQHAESSNNPDLQIAIIDRNRRDFRIPQKSWSIIQENLLLALSCRVKLTQNTNITMFDCRHWEYGVKIVQCENMEAVQFIKQFINKMSLKCKREEYDVIPINQLPQRTTIKVFIPRPKIEDDAILHMLKAQNHRHNSWCWTLLKSRASANRNGIYLYISISATSLQCLKRDNAEIRYGSKRLKVELPQEEDK